MSLRLKPLAEQRIVITGASSGIGLATARMAAERGAAVLLVARNEEALRDAAENIRTAGGRAAHLAIDVAEPDAAERIGAAAGDAFGGFDTWVNGASVSEYARLSEMTMDEHRRIFDVNYFAYVQGSLHAAAALRETSGALINVGSVLSDRAIPMQGAYSAAKHAVKGFTDALRTELEMDGTPVSVTLIKPGPIDTPFPEHARNKMDAPATLPPPVYDPKLVAEAILFAAEHPKRELTVGGGGVLMSAGNLLARATDKAMELFGERSQQGDTPPQPEAADNLFEARADGRIHSNQDLATRQSSLALKAQMHPMATAALIGGGAAAAAGAFFGGRAMARKREGRMNAVMETAITAQDLAAGRALSEPHPPTEPRLQVATEQD